MGISTTGGGKGSMSEPNIVPLIDILLVLIIIFMVVTPLIPKGLDALVPQPSPDDATDVVPNERVVVIQVECVDPACRVTSVKLNEEEQSWDTLEYRLEDIFKKRAEKVVFVKGADNLEFSHVAQAIDIAKGAGIDKIGLITAKIERGE
ncbi:MAG: ExbD/TolR family protein [Terriglobia bacterium]